MRKTLGSALAAALLATACAAPPRVAVRPVPPAVAPVPAAPVAPVATPTPTPAPALPTMRPIEPATAASAAGAAESAGVAARFPDPPVSYRTPAFEPGRTGFTTNAELRNVLNGLVREGGATSIRLVQAGSSQTGVPLEALHFSRGAVPLAASGATARAPRPVVLLVGQQHGDEPAGAEALLVIAQSLAGGPLAAVLDRIDVVILPRANPDGAAVERRTSAGGIDVNRDHLLLRTPEAQAVAQLVREFNPVVVVDAHEFSVLGRYIEKFGAVQRFDALVQYAMTANLPEFVTKASEEWFRKPMLQALSAQGLSHEWYYTTSTDVSDKKVSMGGVLPDTGRNVNGLRNAVSFLIETRGVGLGRAHLLRRVHTHVVAITSVLQSAAARAEDLQKLRRFVDADVAAKACQGEAIVEAVATPSEYNLRMLDPQTGADKTVNVTWDSALELNVVKRRPRPCGYWLGADQTDAVLRLRALGVQVQRLDEPGALRGAVYTETARELATRSDVRGSIADAGGILKLKVELVPALVDVRAGSYYVGLDQPLANLVIAALEPDTQSGFVANRIVTELKSLARVQAPPETKMTPMQ
ncbi:M14 family metallocarboxypeptidase [Rhizobacter sp. Root404]|uniref:M14 family metallopeptidase n=1 Tax=Rhizobacter sp. Root404 TaxID=1736528 RepID=UPI001F3E2AB5|nr:M14 family metallocarboxypeptidase [Rhizobacter sp. Root404]